ncbi:hypothetical protein GCM10009579_86550 [Streptomyces javensis]|uniref:Uncharacterized protein n=1 Tax=Streptomyces javensis TaxID=114698 RepID=A0ABN1XHD1_9ACTN
MVAGRARDHRCVNRCDGQRPCGRRALAPAAGELAGERGRLALAEADLGEQLPGAGGPVRPARQAVQAQHPVDGRADADARVQREVRVLEDDLDRLGPGEAGHPAPYGRGSGHSRTSPV